MSPLKACLTIPIALAALWLITSCASSPPPPPTPDVPATVQAAVATALAVEQARPAPTPAPTTRPALAPTKAPEPVRKPTPTPGKPSSTALIPSDTDTKHFPNAATLFSGCFTNTDPYWTAIDVQAVVRGHDGGGELVLDKEVLVGDGKLRPGERKCWEYLATQTSSIYAFQTGRFYVTWQAPSSSP